MKHEHLTYHQWRGEPRDQESPLTDNDPWECLLRTNADLGREVSELKKQRDALSSQLQGVIVACHLRGYHVGDSLGEWIEKQFEDAQARLAHAGREIEGKLNEAVAKGESITHQLGVAMMLLHESHAREAQLRAALDAPPHDTQHVECVCYSKNPTQVQVGYICNKCRALTLPAPPVVQVEDVKPLVEALTRIKEATDAPDIDVGGEMQFGLHCGVEDRSCQDRYEGADYGWSQGVERTLEWSHNESNHALSTFTAKHKL